LQFPHHTASGSYTSESKLPLLSIAICTWLIDTAVVRGFDMIVSSKCSVLKVSHVLVLVIGLKSAPGYGDGYSSSGAHQGPHFARDALLRVTSYSVARFFSVKSASRASFGS